MLKRLRLQQFKNFKDVELELGSFTLLVGTNASGKSNIRDAFRFLHGISRGYSLAEIIGEKYIEAGVLQWRGIRGGIREITFQGTDYFSLEALFSFGNHSQQEASYYIEVNLIRDGNTLSIVNERLSVVGQDNSIFNAEFDPSQGQQSLLVKVLDSPLTNHPIPFNLHRPIISQLAELSTDVLVGENAVVPGTFIRGVIKAALQALTSSTQFLDLDPDAMRMPSLPGQIILGDRGENLSSVLQAICEDSERKQVLIQWIQELTPMDAKNFEFPSDFTGRILLTLVEENGQKTSAYSASDGTLRFLAMIAALLGPEPARFYFIEELDNGIHPTRLHLLLQLIERQVSARNIQIVATTHSPQLLRLLSPKSLENASLVYRLPDRADAKVKRIIDIPEAKQVIEKQDLANLYESGWLEDVVYFLEDEETVE